jgi:hypothetical protein
MIFRPLAASLALVDRGAIREDQVFLLYTKLKEKTGDS